MLLGKWGGGGDDWSGNRFFCLLRSHSLHIDYEVQDLLLSSLFGSGGEGGVVRGRKASAPCLCGCKPVLCLKKVQGLSPQQHLWVWFSPPSVSISSTPREKDHTQKDQAAVSKEMWEQLFCLDVLWWPLFRPAQEILLDGFSCWKNPQDAALQ